MEQMNLAGVSTFVQHVAIKLKQPTMIRGRFGVGKSAILAAITAALDNEEALDTLLGDANRYTEDGSDYKYTGAMICDIRLAQYDSVDLRGFPGVDKGTALTVWYAPATLPFVGNPNFPTDKIIILFLDEITSAKQEVAAVAYQLVNDRCVGEHELMPNVVIVAAGNREDDNGVVNRMPMPLCNRMTWVEAVHDHALWAEWAQSEGIHPIILAFIHFKPDLMMTYNPKVPEKVVATPRTWEKAAKYFVDDMPEEIKWAAIKGAIGAGPATELRAFQQIWMKVTPIKDIIANPDKVPVPATADMRYATAISVSGAMNAKTLTPLYTFLKRMQPEMVMLAWQMAIKRDQSLLRTPDFLDFTKRFRSVFSL